MKVTELSKEELSELKQRYYLSKNIKDISIDEIIRIDEIISDEEIIEKFSGINFVKDDFFCNIEGIDENII